MPQPLSNFQWTHLRVGNNTDAPSKHRPALALLAMQAIAEWSILEGFMAGLFVKLLGANPKPAASMYSSLTSTVAQRAAFRAVADANIPDEIERDVFEAILSRYKSLSTERNKLAHWIWGFSDNIPDAVLLCDPREMMAMDVDMEEEIQAFRARKRVTLKDSFPTILVYKEIDFTNLSRDIQVLIRQVGEFRSVVSRHPANSDGAVLRRLLTAPEIESFVDRLRQRRKTQQEAQQQQPQTPPPTDGK